MTARALLLGGASALLLGAAPALAQGSEYAVPAFEVVADADVDHVYPDGSTPLMWAVYDGDAQRVRQLIRAGADVAAVNDYGSSAMQLAAEIGNADIIEMLLDAGADADSANPEGQTALMLVARTGNVDAARLLIRAGATIDARETWGEQTALMWASARRHPEMVALLVDEGADVNARSKWRDYQRHITSEARAKSLDTGGLTPLLYAARENCLECARVLIENGVDVDLPDPDRTSPLLLSILNRNWDIAALLIEAGADVDQFDIYGQSPLYAISSRRANMARTSIDSLTEATGSDVMAALIAHGANPNMQLFTRAADQRGGGISRGSTPLHAAAGAGDLEGVQMLIAAGADVNLNDADNETALMLVMRDGSGSLFGGGSTTSEDDMIQIMRVLHGAGIDINANALYHHLARLRGGTALHYAVRAGSVAAVDELISYGVDLDMKDPDGLTALDYAEARGYIPFLQMRQPARTDIAEKLRAAGATVELPQEPYWEPVSPPVYYEATVWPVAADVPSRSYEDMTPSPFLAEAVANLEYTGTPQPEPRTAPVAADEQNEETTDQASLNDASTVR